MTTCIFLGPTLPVDQGRSKLDALYLPPAAQGDVYRAALGHPTVIGLVDGYFDTVPAVWHKEILWAMAQGIYVFGSASMGALRAAELCTFGMHGVGEIFAGYRDGNLEDDDEVALVHAPPEQGFAPRSTPLVNIRATLSAARAQEVIDSSVADCLLTLARNLFYPDRSYPRLLRDARVARLPEAPLDAFEAWLARGQIDQKRADALAMLDRIAAFVRDSPPPMRVNYHFEETVYWDELRRAAASPPNRVEASQNPDARL